MFVIRSEFDGRDFPFSLCHILCLCATWLRVTHGLPQAGTNDYAPNSHLARELELIPSAAGSATVPPASVLSQTNPAEFVPSVPVRSGVVRSELSPVSQLPPAHSMPALLVSISTAPIPSVPLTSSLQPIPPALVTTYASCFIYSSVRNVTGTPVMQSTDEGLRPIPPAATQVGDPNGHHEITEPNFTATRPCRGCSPVIEITATGWLDSPAEEQQGSTSEPMKATISAGPSNILISQISAGGNFVIGGSTTITPGQTITIGSVPVAVQTTVGRIEVVVGTTVFPLLPSEVKSYGGTHTTRIPTPLPPVLTIGTEFITVNPQTQYIVSGQTLSPGGSEITIAGTIISLAPSATAVIINGATLSFTPIFGNTWTTTVLALTLNNCIYPANRAGYITISSGIVLKPGGEAITVNGTTLSLGTSGTVAILQGITSILQPVTTVVTLTKSVGGGNVGYTSDSRWALPTGKAEIPAKPISAGGVIRPKYITVDGWLCGVLILAWWGLGYLAVRR